MSIIDTMIVNRTNADYYNVTDLNRVGEALNYIKGRYVDIGYTQFAWTAKTDWAITDIPNVSQLTALLGYVENCREILSVAPVVPGDMNYLTASEANDIEQILINCDTTINHIIAAYRYCGVTQCGGGGII